LKKLRALVVGLGRIGWDFHIPSIVNNKGFELVAVVDPLKERTDEAEQKFGCRPFLNLEEALEKEKPDLTVIASPTKFHAEQTITAFRHGSDVFCDKPMAVFYQEAQDMADAMKKYGRKFMMYQPRRISADFMLLKQILAEDLIGPVFMIKRATSNYERRNDWQAFLKNGGGMLNNYGAHYVDQVLNIAGSKAVKMDCQLRVAASLGDAEDVVKVIIETENGILIDVDINQAAAITLPEWYIFGKYGAMKWENGAWRVRYYNPAELKDVKTQDGLAASSRAYGNGEAIPWKEKAVSTAETVPVDYYDKCYEYYALGDLPFVDVNESMEVMRVLKICREKAGIKLYPQE